MQKNIAIILIIMMLLGCSQRQKEAVKPSIPKATLLFNHTAFQTFNVPTEDTIFVLPKQEQEKFLAYAQRAKQQNRRADRIVADYLESKMGNFTYDGATLNASQTIEQNQGNCISLAILTQAYANLIGLETSFSEVASMPVYSKIKNTLLISSHFKTKLYAPQEEKNENWFVIIRPGTVIDYFPANDILFLGKASYQDLLAKYYANLATEALLKNQFNHSYSLLLKAFDYAPYDPELINLAAILHRRKGDLNTAQSIFEYAMSNQLVSSNLLHSYIYLAQQLQDDALVARLDQELEFNAKNPFDSLQLAERFIEKKHYTNAENLLQGIITYTPYIPEPYFVLAKLYYQRGHIRKAQSYLEKALARAEDQEKQGVYQAKLNTLKQYSQGYNEMEEQNQTRN